MSADRIEVSTGTLLSLSTGRFLADTFGDMHAAADVVMGQPLMTHHFASEAVDRQLKAEVKRQHPWTADVDEDGFPNLSGMSVDQARQTCLDWVQQFTDRHGATHVLVSPPETRHVPLFEGLENLGKSVR